MATFFEILIILWLILFIIGKFIEGYNKYNVPQNIRQQTDLQKRQLQLQQQFLNSQRQPLPVEEQLRKAEKLLSENLITEEEYQALRHKILGI